MSEDVIEPSRRRRRLATAALMAAVACGSPEPVPEEAPAEVEAGLPAPPPASGLYGAVAPESGGRPSVLLLRRTDGAVPAAPGVDRVDQLGVQFVPRLAVVRPGVPISFTNGEAIAHNITVRRVEDGATVLSEDTPPSEALEHVFDVEGGYDLTCEVHPGMSAFLFVTDAPLVHFAEPDGAFRLPDLPSGTWALSVWSADPEGRWEDEVVVEDGASTEVGGPASD